MRRYRSFIRGRRVLRANHAGGYVMLHSGCKSKLLSEAEAPLFFDALLNLEPRAVIVHRWPRREQAAEVSP